MSRLRPPYDVSLRQCTVHVILQTFSLCIFIHGKVICSPHFTVQPQFDAYARESHQLLHLTSFV